MLDPFDQASRATQSHCDIFRIAQNLSTTSAIECAKKSSRPGVRSSTYPLIKILAQQDGFKQGLQTGCRMSFTVTTREAEEEAPLLILFHYFLSSSRGATCVSHFGADEFEETKKHPEQGDSQALHSERLLANEHKGEVLPKNGNRIE